MQDKADPENSIVASHPELHVALSVAGILDRVAAEIAISLGLPISDQKRVSEVIRDRMRTNRDAHVPFEQIGEDLDFTAGITVERTFLSLRAEEFPQEVEAMSAPVRGVMPGVKKMEAASSAG